MVRLPPAQSRPHHNHEWRVIIWRRNDEASVWGGVLQGPHDAAEAKRTMSCCGALSGQR